MIEAGVKTEEYRNITPYTILDKENFRCGQDISP